MIRKFNIANGYVLNAFILESKAIPHFVEWVEQEDMKTLADALLGTIHEVYDGEGYIAWVKSCHEQPAWTEHGSWFNPQTNQCVHPDLNHVPLQGPHYDYIGPNQERLILVPGDPIPDVPELDSPVPASDDDWRLGGQETYLMGAVLAWREWSAPPISTIKAWRLADGRVREMADHEAESPSDAVEQMKARWEWDHDHCDFCWAKFMEADYPPDQHEWRKQHPEILTAGYTLAKSEPRRSRVWICPECFKDFRERFQWTVAS